MPFTAPPHHASVLVTGASGFLGRPLVAAFVRAGYEVTALGWRQVDSLFPANVGYMTGDLTDRRAAQELLAPWRWDAVVHAAGPVPQGAAAAAGAEMLAQHVRILLNVCAAIPQAWSGRFIHTSSMSVYGMPQYLPVDEGHPCRPEDAYGMAKLLAEEVLSTMAERSGWDLWIFRLPGLFSEQRRNGALIQFMQAALRGEPLAILPAQPMPWDVLHVDDAVEAILRVLFLEVRSPGAMNIAYGEPVELEAMAERIARQAGTGSTVQNIGGARHPVFQMDIALAKRLLGWPPTTLQARLEALWRAIQRAHSEVPAT